MIWNNTRTQRYTENNDFEIQYLEVNNEGCALKTNIRRLPESAILNAESVSLDYEYRLSRIHKVV